MSINKYKKMIIKAAVRAIRLEVFDNIKKVILSDIDKSSYNLIFILKTPPSESDLESMSLIETEIISDVWNWIEKFNYKWQLAIETNDENYLSTVIYDNGKLIENI